MMIHHQNWGGLFSDKPEYPCWLEQDIKARLAVLSTLYISKGQVSFIKMTHQPTGYSKFSPRHLSYIKYVVIYVYVTYINKMYYIYILYILHIKYIYVDCMIYIYIFIFMYVYIYINSYYIILIIYVYIYDIHISLIWNIIKKINICYIYILFIIL